MMHTCDNLLLNANTIDQNGAQKKNQAIAIEKGIIVWCGSEEALPISYKENAKVKENCAGKLITPTLIDCHTHLVYAGSRASEFQQRLKGASYSEIAHQGGGILSTVQKTRAASEEQLVQESLPRILALKFEGVRTVEIKSGYGLDLQTELKMLKVAKSLGKITGVRVFTTFLGAHATPSEYNGRAQDYVDFLCQEMLPAIVESGLADAMDVFCDSIGFTLAQTEQLFIQAQNFGLPVKCHAEQLSHTGATSLATKFKALSCDHLEHLDDSGVMAMAKANTVAVLLPGAYYFLHETRRPPIDLLRAEGVGMAVATDCNPGSSPTASLLLMMNMACQLFSLTVEEVLSGVTYHAARALGVDNQIGAIAEGMSADLLRWGVSEGVELCYHFGYPLPHEAMIAGKWEKQ